MTGRIGIMGGTFNPIHLGHLIVAEAAREVFNLECVVFVPASTPPHKQNMEIAPAEARLEMVKLATASNPYFKVSDSELKRGGISYTYNTIQVFLNEGVLPDDLFYITGADSILTIDTWKNYETLLELCHFIGSTRPGIQEQALLKKIEGLRVNEKFRIHPLIGPAVDISSTLIRERIANAKSIKYLVPEAVEAYISDKGLYTNMHSEV